mmetsp:Transcript_8536/g.11202  ORF Transcript_8536/g.11202 Transcript_8536/m.11202 type:complete len:95 (+) Transcript_8536:143-427(+)
MDFHQEEKKDIDTAFTNITITPSVLLSSCSVHWFLHFSSSNLATHAESSFCWRSTTLLSSHLLWETDLACKKDTHTAIYGQDSWCKTGFPLSIC